MKTTFPKNYVYVLRTAKTRHMVGFIDFYFHFPANFASYVLYNLPVLCHVSHTVSLFLYGLLLSLVVFFYLCKVLFSGFLQFNGHFFSMVKITQNTVTLLLFKGTQSRYFRA